MSDQPNEMEGISHAIAALSAKTLVLEAMLLCALEESKVDRYRLIASFERYIAIVESRYVNADIPDIHVDLLHQAIQDAKKNLVEF
jgi:hypothetical protein